MLSSDPGAHEPGPSLASVASEDASSLDVRAPTPQLARSSAGRPNPELAYARAFCALAPALPKIVERGILTDGVNTIATYALWEDIHAALTPTLHRFGFALSFRTGLEAGLLTVTCVLRHKKGHSESTTLHLAPDLSGDKNPVQAVGSSLSYGKRYAACALLNIATVGEDDDAQSACPTLTFAQLGKLEQEITATGADRDRLLRYFRVRALDALPPERFGEALAALRARAELGAAA